MLLDSYVLFVEIGTDVRNLFYSQKMRNLRTVNCGIYLIVITNDSNYQLCT